MQQGYILKSENQTKKDYMIDKQENDEENLTLPKMSANGKSAEL